MIHRCFFFFFVFSCSLTPSTLNLEGYKIGRYSKISLKMFFGLFEENERVIQYITYISQKERKKIRKAQVFFRKIDGVLKVSVLNQVGIEVLSASVRPKSFKVKSHFKKFGREFFYNVVANMLVTLLKTKELRAQLFGPIRIEDGALERNLYEGNILVGNIHYSDHKKWPKKIQYTDSIFRHKLIIETP